MPKTLILYSRFKVRMAQKLGYREAYERGTNLQKQSDTDFEGVPGIVSLFIFWIFLDVKMVFLILDIFIFAFIMF